MSTENSSIKYKKVGFDLNLKIIPIKKDEVNDNLKQIEDNFNILLQEDNEDNEDNKDEDNDTDYEEEFTDPRETLLKLLKKRSFGEEEFGDDYQSNVELKRKIETTFNSFKKKSAIDFYIPDFKNIKNNNNSSTNTNDVNDVNDVNEINNIDAINSIIGKDKDKNLQPCPNKDCNEIMTINYNSCQVCFRETIDVRCPKCIPNILDLCSEKCKDIFNGSTIQVNITNDLNEPFIVIEDDGENMVLSVINHKIFYEELSHKDLLMINKPCINCNPENNLNNGNEDNDEDNLENNQDNLDKEDIENNDNIIKNGVIPVKCYNCNDNYSYLIACGQCYLKSGLLYICEECE